MIIIGDKLVPFEDFAFIKNIENIKNTKANSTLCFSYDEDILKYAYGNSLNTAVIVKNIKQAIYSNALNARYIISSKDLAKDIQKIADTYMFDSKNLAIISSNEEFEQIAKDEIDGVIYQELVK